MNYWLFFSAVFVPGVPPNAAEHEVCVGVLDDVCVCCFCVLIPPTQVVQFES